MASKTWQGHSIWGYARTNIDQLPGDRLLKCAMHWRGALTIRQYDPRFLKDPSFYLAPLNSGFFEQVYATGSQVHFEFNGQELGWVTHISGAGARDYGQEVRQTISSLHGKIGWSSDGLKLSVEGALAPRMELMDELGPVACNAATYEISIIADPATARLLFEEVSL